jgi:large subunit ribosomal protein L22
MNSLVKRIATLSVSRARGCVSTLSGVSTPGTQSMSIAPRTWQFPSTQYRSFSTELTEHPSPTETETSKVFTDGGEQFGMVLDTRLLPKLKPSVVRRRLDKCKTYIGREKAIRQSPWKLNRVCQLAAGLTLEEALTQLQFCDIKNAALVAKVLRRTSNLGDIRDGLQMSQLEVAECFTTKSMMLKRVKPMGRGRYV